ncbi:MAG: ATP synthase subunit I [Gammaproteobacteria bacterium]|nr:ATP synthase subunit I [Gammaproteobacteria bacterium]
MGAAADEFTSGLRRVVVTQLLLTALLAAGFFAFQDRSAGLAAGYGGAVTALISAWLGWRMKTATRSARRMAVAGLGGLYLANLTRYALAFLLLAFGLGVLKLSPIPLVIAFVVTQFGFVSAAWRPK